MTDRSSLDHIPVMLDEALSFLQCRPGGHYVDATAGGGGYSEAIIEASAPDGILLAIDRDDEAVRRTAERLRRFGERVKVVKAPFSEIAGIVESHRFEPVDGIVADLGVSSYQLGDPHRGFSFSSDGPLDMRMDPKLETTAADIVNSTPERDLANLIYRLGEEKWSRRIARKIVERRKAEPFTGTVDLAEVIAKCVPRTKDSTRIHPATRTFQALRLAVNGELEELRTFLNDAFEVLRPGGRLCVVSFHSLEDRIVKNGFRDWSKACRCPSEMPVCSCGGKALARLLTRRAIGPQASEREANPRARSGRLRAVEKI